MEPFAIGVFVTVVALSRAKLPAHIELGEALLLGAAVLLAQGLVRDLVRWRRTRTTGPSPARRITCVCTESSIGATAILAGILVLFGTTPTVVHVPSMAWPIAAAAITVFGFTTRHLVFDWRTRRVRWEPAHDGIVVWR